MHWWRGRVIANEGEEPVWLFTERFFDARRMIWQILGKFEGVEVACLHAGEPPKESYEQGLVYKAFWTGSAAGLNDLKLNCEQVKATYWKCSKCSTIFHVSETEVIGGKRFHLVQYERPGSNPAVNGCGPVNEVQNMRNVKKRKK